MDPQSEALTIIAQALRDEGRRLAARSKALREALSELIDDAPSGSTEEGLMGQDPCSDSLLA
jgi:hypothetical protein